jgi:hypothetical protein
MKLDELKVKASEIFGTVMLWGFIGFMVLNFLSGLFYGTSLMDNESLRP